MERTILWLERGIVMTQSASDATFACLERSRALTSLVLQMSPSVDPQALPGVAFHGMIPVAVKVKSFIHFIHISTWCKEKLCSCLRKRPVNKEAFYGF